MSESFLNGRVTLHPGDCLDVLATLEENSIDSVVTDPPYHLTSIVKRFGAENAAPAQSGKTGAYKRASAGFMGKQWDGGEIAFEPETWAAVMRVLKPGAFLVAFAATRNYHRMACAIEDAGFEIRNMLSWNFGSGFPKSHNVSKVLGDAKERCTCDPDLRGVRIGVDAEDALPSSPQQDVFAEMCGGGSQSRQNGVRTSGRNAQGQASSGVRCVREDVLAERQISGQESEAGLLAPMQRSVSRAGLGKAWPQGSRGEDARKLHSGGPEDDRPDQPGVEGRRDLPEAARQLREREIRPMPARIPADGADGRLRDGASAGDGFVDWPTADANGVRASHRPSAAEQRQDELGTLAVQPQSQKRGTWDHCRECGKPIVPNGLGTDLKPAHEPICLARKPLSESTVAANVLRWGTGALNIDGCRVGTADDQDNARRDKGSAGVWNGTGDSGEGRNQSGRWPANVLHDGSDEVVRGFPERHVNVPGSRGKSEFWGTGEQDKIQSYDNEGSAARFFYSAKADSDDRLGSKHPTIKPVDLIQYLTRLVTPPRGTVLDCFAGTGTTGEAAWREGFNAVLIEREEEYQADIRRRMALCMSGPDERARESIKARTKDKPVDHGPLFGAAMTAQPVEQSPLSREPLQ